MGKIYHRSWRRRKVLALSLGAGVATALVLPAFGRGGDVEAGAAANDGAAPTGDMNQATAGRVDPPDDVACVVGDDLVACDRPARKHRARRADRWRAKRPSVTAP